MNIFSAIVKDCLKEEAKEDVIINHTFIWHPQAKSFYWYKSTSNKVTNYKIICTIVDENQAMGQKGLIIYPWTKGYVQEFDFNNADCWLWLLLIQAILDYYELEITVMTQRGDPSVWLSNCYDQGENITKDVFLLDDRGLFISIDVQKSGLENLNRPRLSDNNFDLLTALGLQQ